MDAFFASVEQRDNPDLVGKPIAVGSTDRRGVVATCSYEARKFGIHSAMPSYRALELCPDVIFVKPRMDAYREAAQEVRKIFYEYTDIVEPASIDEAYLDITSNTNGDIEEAKRIGEEIRKEIEAKVKVTASIGVSVNKFLAKTASDMNKPNGLTVVTPEEIDDFLYDLPIGKFRGIGKKTAPRMIEEGILTGRHLRELTMEELVELFGDRRSKWFYNIARGIDDRPVESKPRERKSIGVSETFEYNLRSDIAAAKELRKLAVELCKRMEFRRIKGRTITVKVKFKDFSITTRSKTLGITVTDPDIMLDICVELLKKSPLKKPVRLFGIAVSNFEDNDFPSLW